MQVSHTRAMRARRPRLFDSRRGHQVRAERDPIRHTPLDRNNPQAPHDPNRYITEAVRPAPARMMRSRSVNRNIIATQLRKDTMQPTFPPSSDDQRYRFMNDDASEPATLPPTVAPVTASVEPFLVRLPDLNDSAGDVAADIVAANVDAAGPLLASSDGESDRGVDKPVVAQVVEPDLVEPNYYDRLRQSMRELPSYVVNVVSDRGRLTSVVASGVILSTAAVLLVIVLQGDNSPPDPSPDDAPPKWTQAVPTVEWSQDVFEKPSPDADARLSSNASAKVLAGDSTSVDAARLTSPWPRESGAVGPLLADGETSDATRSDGRPNVAANISAANEPARVARLSGIIEPMTDIKHRR